MSVNSPEGINITWKDALAVNDILRMEIYRDTSDVTYDYEYYCYTLPEKKLTDFAWSIFRLKFSKAGDLLSRNYAMIPGETSQVFRFKATDLATVKALPFNEA